MHVGFHLGIPKERYSLSPRLSPQYLYIDIGYRGYPTISYLIRIVCPYTKNPGPICANGTFFRSQVLKELGIEDPLLNVAQELEKVPRVPREISGAPKLV